MRKPRILGILHSPIRSAPLESRGYLENERRRIDAALERLPHGSHVGVELPKKYHGHLMRGEKSDAHTENLLLYAALKTRERGGKVVSLESESAYRRSKEVAFKKRDAVVLARVLHPTAEEEVRKLFDVREWIFDKLRSIPMGKRILRGKLPLAIVGDAHAQDLNPSLGSTHAIERSPAPPIKYLNAVEERKIPTRLKKRLNEHITRQIERFKRAQARREKKLPAGRPGAISRLARR